MQNEREELEREIHKTTQELKAKLEALETQARERVQEISQGVNDTVQGISDGMSKLTLRHQVETRPGVVLAASVGAGYLVGKKMTRRRARYATPLENTVQRPTSPGLVSRAAHAAAPMLLAVGVNALATWARRKYPKSADAISFMETTFSARL